MVNDQLPIAPRTLIAAEIGHPTVLA